MKNLVVVGALTFLGHSLGWAASSPTPNPNPSPSLLATHPPDPEPATSDEKPYPARNSTDFKTKSCNQSFYTYLAAGSDPQETSVDDIKDLDARKKNCGHTVATTPKYPRNYGSNPKPTPKPTTKPGDDEPKYPPVDKTWLAAGSCPECSSGSSGSCKMVDHSQTIDGGKYGEGGGVISVDPRQNGKVLCGGVRPENGDARAKNDGIKVKYYRVAWTCKGCEESESASSCSGSGPLAKPACAKKPVATR